MSHTRLLKSECYAPYWFIRAKLASAAYAGALDFRHRFLNNNYEISGSFDQSRVEGSPSTILSLQRNGVHNYQRPDANLPLNPNRTVLTGDAVASDGELPARLIGRRDEQLTAAGKGTREAVGPTRRQNGRCPGHVQRLAG